MVRKWHLKAIVQKTISFLPNGHKVNYWFQKHVTKGVYLGDTYFYDRLEHAQHHLAIFERYRGSIAGQKTLELGTGWYPVIPISLFLCGVERVHTVDISNLLNKEKFETTLERFMALIEQGKLKDYLPAAKEARIDTFQAVYNELSQLSLAEALQKLHITYWVEDARDLKPLANDSIDLVHSNNTFEHVYPDILKAILLEFKRVVKPNGVQSHFVDMSDHFAHFDTSINIYNFLKYSNKTWDKIIDNSIQPQNRWRYPQFLDLYQSLGIPVSDTDYRPGDQKALDSLKVHADFSKFSKEELAISHCYLYSNMSDNVS